MCVLIFPTILSETFLILRRIQRDMRIYIYIYIYIYIIYIYRVIQEESAILWEMIVCVILSKKVHMNMGPTLDGYGVMGIY